MGTDDDETKRDGDRPTIVETPRRRETITRAWLPERYEVTDLLGEGGMGEVFAARDEVIGREVAIKRMLEASPSEAATSRFMREARIQGALDHPAIPPVHELAYDADGQPYFVMKRLKGTTLASILSDRDRDKYPRERLLRAFADVCLAVELAHTRGIVHRDLKPGNIMLGDFGEVYVLDWGVAKVLGDFDPSLKSLRMTTPRVGATEHGTVIGTPGYMAPEQAAGAEIDSRADVYALGCVLFEILSGKRMRSTTADRPSRASPEEAIPPELDDLCVASTIFDVEARLTTARELGERVQRFLDGDRDLAMRRKLATEHLVIATAAMTRDDQEALRIAIREGGRALALDPTLPGAAELVGRVMIEPPRTFPPEVEADIAASELVAMKEQARIAGLSYFAYAIFVPVLLWIGIRDATYLIAFVALLAVLIAVMWQGMNKDDTDARVGITVVGNALLIALIARMFSPFLVAPGIAVLIVVILMGSAAFRRGYRVVLLVASMLIAILGPWLLELTHVIEATTTFSATHILITTPTLEVRPVPTQIGLMLYVVGLITFATMIRRALARVEEAARRQLLLHAWQLRQLVPA